MNSCLALINEFLGQPPNASEHGYQIDHILEFAHWFMGALFVGWSAFFIFVLIRFRKSRHPKADHAGVRSGISTHLEFSVVLIEAVLLTDEEKVKACTLAKEAGADFVKTSTGFAAGGATVEDVALMRRVVGSKMGVKAAGGITFAQTEKTAKHKGMPASASDPERNDHCVQRMRAVRPPISRMSCSSRSA